MSKRILIVDGYNVLNAWRGGITDALSLADAREALADKLLNYAGYSGQRVILVYDAWLSDRLQRSREQRGALSVIYTQKGETADHYIERLCDGYARDAELNKLEVRVATSDLVEQTVILGRGATRISARELLTEMEQTGKRSLPEKPKAIRSTLADRLPNDVLKKLERLRRG